MRKLWKLFLLLLIFSLLMPGSADAIYKGDIDNNRKMELQDAILALQLVSGITPPTPVFKSSAISGNQKIGIAEVIYILQVLSDARIPLDQTPLSSQLVRETNWRVLRTYDQTNISSVENSTSRVSASYTTQSLTDIITYTASGLVAEFIDQLYVDENYVVAGSLEAGFSYIKRSEISNPRGKVYNYRGRNTGNAVDRFGCSGFTKRSSDNKIYAWYGLDIVDVLSKTIVYSNAPDYTHGYYYIGPKDRFVTDENGNFWIGTSNLDQNGNLSNNPNSNGLYKISSDFTSRTTLLGDIAVWNIFKDSQDVIWVSSNKGIYRKPLGQQTPLLVYDSIVTGHYGNQIFEFNSEIYAVIKNFFHNPIPVSNRTFELFKWNGSQFVRVCDILQSPSFDDLHAFTYNGQLYVVRRGNSGPLIYNNDSQNPAFAESGYNIGESMGQTKIYTEGKMLFSAGNTYGIPIYNGDSNQTMKLTPVNTAEALITDNIHSLYSALDKRMFVGPEASGFNIYTNNHFEIFELLNEGAAVGFFEYQGKPYIQGTSNLYRLESDGSHNVIRFPTNREKIYYDNRGYVWSFPNWGAGYGGIGVLDLATLNVKGTKDSFDGNYWNAPEMWTLDRSYHFYDIISIPGENSVFIAVGESEMNYPVPSMPYVLKYNYTSNTFTKVNLPDLNSQGIRVFATDGTVVYGVGRQKLFIYKDGVWNYLCPIQLGNDFRGAKISGKYLIIISGWNSNGRGLFGGVEVVDLETKTSVHYDKSQIPIPTNAIFAIEIQNFGNNNFRLWLGTFSGLAYCDLVIEDTVITPVIPPHAPTGLTFDSCSEGTANLRWDGNSTPNLAGYKVFYGTQPGIYGTAISVGNVTNYQVTGLNPNVTWYFAVTAVDSSSPVGESTYSAEVSCMGSGLPTISLTGRVVDSNDAALSNVTIEMVGNPLINTTSDSGGNFIIFGIPSGSDFALKFNQNDYIPAYFPNLRSTSNLKALRPVVLFPISQLAAWNIEPGKAVITTQVVNYANPSQGYISGAVVTAESALGQNYVVQYFDGNAYGGSATYGNGSFYIFNVMSGDTVTVRTQKDGWTFTTRVYVTHADSVSEGTVYGTSSP